MAHTRCFNSEASELKSTKADRERKRRTLFDDLFFDENADSFFLAFQVVSLHWAPVLVLSRALP